MKNSQTRNTGFGASILGGLVAVFLCGTTAPVWADAGDTLDLSGFERMTDQSLGGLRGGFRAGNLDLSFGVTMQTSVNGQQILQTVFNSGQDAASTQAATGGWTFTQVNGGFQATSADGTSITHRVGQSIDTDIANSADNRVIQNNTTLDLFINNLSQVQAQAAVSHSLSNIMNEMSNHAALGN